MKVANYKFTTLFFLFMMFGISSCELEIEPEDLKTITSLLEEPDGIITATNGNYALLKENLAFNGQEDCCPDTRNDYTRHLYQMSEFAADNVMYTQFSTDNLYNVFTREHIPDLLNSTYFWFIAYRIMLGTNLIIDYSVNNSLEGEDPATDQIIGENYFLRALVTFDLLQFYAKPYTHGLDNPGIILRKSPSEEGIKPRSTVGECYESVVEDLLKAEQLMTDDEARGVEFASKVAAQALLSRVYLYMEQNDKAVEYADKVINTTTPLALASRANYVDNFANTPNSTESIFIIRYNEIEFTGGVRGYNSSIGSMYYDNGTGVGWGEVFASETLLNEVRANPEDVRNDLILSTGFTKSGYDIHYILKFTGQNGVVNLSSPQRLRLSEVYLNRAEAKAKIGGQDQSALDDVNVIRERAGLSGAQLYSTGNLDSKSVLDVVLEERRLEMAFEGHRGFDLLRNKQNLNRCFTGIHRATETVNGVEVEVACDQDPATDISFEDDRSIFFIPTSELLTNPECEQND